MPESIRWLVIKGKIDEAKAVVCRAAKFNNIAPPLYLLDATEVIHLSFFFSTTYHE